MHLPSEGVRNANNALLFDRREKNTLENSEFIVDCHPKRVSGAN